MDEIKNKNIENYTEEMATEDRKLVLFWAHKSVRLYPFLQFKEDDLISYLYYHVVKLRQNYTSEIGVKYGSYVLQNFKFLTMNYIAKFFKDKNNDNKSLDATIDGTDDFSLMETIKVDCDFDAKANYLQLLKYIEQATKTLKPRQAKIVNDYVIAQNICIVAKQNDCSRQYVDLIIKKFRIHLKEILLQNQFVNEQFFKSELTDKYTTRKNKINYSAYGDKFGLRPSVMARLYKKYLDEKQSISFEQYIQNYKDRKQILKNMTKSEKYKFYAYQRQRRNANG